jgi:hypothetical protein
MQFIRIHLKNKSSACRREVSVRAKIILDYKIFGCVKDCIRLQKAMREEMMLKQNVVRTCIIHTLF